MNLKDYYLDSPRNILYKKNDKLCIQDTDSAYKLQKKITKDLGDIGGWKLGGTTQVTRNAFNTDKLYFGPIKKLDITSWNEEIFNLYPGHKVMGELEIAYKLSKDIDINQDYTEHDCLSFFDEIAPAIEIPSSLLDFPENGLLLLIADCCASGMLILGPSHKINVIEDHNIEINLMDDQDIIARGNSNTLIDGLKKTLVNFIKTTQEKKIPVKKNQWISTGGLTACVHIPLNEKIRADFSSLGSFNFIIKNKL